MSADEDSPPSARRLGRNRNRPAHELGGRDAAQRLAHPAVPRDLCRRPWGWM